MSSHDDELVPFLTYLIHSIQIHFPKFGHSILDQINSSSFFNEEKRVLSLSSLFINEIVAIDEEVTVILDDFHHAEKSSMIQEFMENVLEHTPSNLHMVISCRSKLKWEKLTQLKVSGWFLEVNQQDFVFTRDEAELLLYDTYNLSLANDHLDQVIKMTEGWAIAVLTMGQQLQGKRDLNCIQTNSSYDFQDLFEYIALEVVLKQALDVQKFLEQTSILEEMSIEACSCMIDIDCIEEMFSSLSNMNLVSKSKNGYRYHTLFKQCLEERFKDTQPAKYKQLNNRVARFFIQKEMYENALAHLEKSGRTDKIAKIIQQFGFQLLKEGKLQSLSDRLQNIPSYEKDTYYLLWFFEGEILRLQSKYEKAEQCYDQTILLSRLHNDFKTKSLANEGKGRIYLDTLQPGKAERHLQQALADGNFGSEFEKDKVATLLLLIVENLINSGKVNKAEKWLQRVKKLDIAMDDIHLMARLYLRTGRLLEAKRILLDLKNDNQETHIPQSHRETSLLLALIEGFIGNAEECKWYSQQSIQHGVQLNSPYIEACGWIRMGHSVQMISSYDSKLLSNAMNRIKYNA